MSKILKKVALIILIIVLVIGGALAFLLSRMADSMGVGNAEVADYDKRIEIWEHPAGYSTDLKIDHMNAKTKGNVFLQQILFASAIVNETYKDEERTIDTFTYLYEIEGGYEKETYYNIPGPHGQVRLTLQQYKDAMGQLFQHFTMELGAFENLITKGDWCAIRYTVKIRNLDAGDEILQNTMEFVKFKKNPDPIGVRVVEGWALSDISLA